MLQARWQYRRTIRRLASVVKGGKHSQTVSIADAEPVMNASYSAQHVGALCAANVHVSAGAGPQEPQSIHCTAFVLQSRSRSRGCASRSRECAHTAVAQPSTPLSTDSRLCRLDLVIGINALRWKKKHCMRGNP